jgi:uncharacterized phiE125 gp8 family phage protein
MSIVLVTGPTDEPVSLGEAKNHLRVDITDDDAYIESLITVARRSCEYIANKKFITQTWNLLLDGFPGSTKLELPKSLDPLESVTHIKYYDVDDQPTTYDAANYVIDIYSQPARIVLKSGSSWPGDILRVANGVEVQVVVGFGDDADVPMEVKQAMLLVVGHLYENREQVTDAKLVEIPRGAKSLLWFDRNVPI